MTTPAPDTAVDSAPIAAIIREGLARESTPEALAAKIAALLENPTWAKAMSHPLRGTILRLLRSEGRWSPVRASRVLDSASLGTIPYHSRRLSSSA